MADTKEVKQNTPVNDAKVTLKPSAVDVIKPENVNGQHLPPYHTEETAKLAEKRAKDVEKSKDEPYEFSANGYTVEEKDAADGVASPNGKVYEVTHDNDKGFTKTFTDKRAAEIFAETHSPRVVA
jgi:hypothetical protein